MVRKCNIKLYLEEKDEVMWTEFFSGYELVTDFSEHGSETSDFINGGKLIMSVREGFVLIVVQKTT